MEVEEYIRRKITRALEKCALVMEETAKMKCAVADRTYASDEHKSQPHLKDTIKSKATESTAECWTDAKYAPFIEYGTRAHMIRPKGDNSLHWQDKDGHHFSKGHMVSGITSAPFMRPALNNNKDLFLKIFKQELKA